MAGMHTWPRCENALCPGRPARGQRRRLAAWTVCQVAGLRTRCRRWSCARRDRSVPAGWASGGRRAWRQRPRRGRGAGPSGQIRPERDHALAARSPGPSMPIPSHRRWRCGLCSPTSAAVR